MPRSVLRLDDLAHQMKRIKELENADAELRRQHKAKLGILREEEKVIRQVLPEDVWYHVNGVGIKQVPSSAIMVRDLESIQQEVEYAKAA